MKIYNRKLAARILHNEAMLVTLITERQFVIPAEEYQKAKLDIEGEIIRDVETLKAAGYSRTGEKLPQTCAVCQERYAQTHPAGRVGTWQRVKLTGVLHYFAPAPICQAVR